MTHSAFDEIKIGSMTLKNRFIKTATYEGMSPNGRVSEALIDHHRKMAENRVGLTTLAYAAVSPEGRTFSDQLLIDEDNLPALKQLAEEIHTAGGKVSIQLGHCGGFSKNKLPGGRAPAGPSSAWNAYGLMYGVPRIRAMDAQDLTQVPQDFALAAKRVQDSGFDAVEIHCGHGYLLSQFLSPAMNKRKDEWGGSLEGRMRLPLAVVSAVREAVGPDFPILAKINTSDGLRNGLEIEETIRVCQHLVKAGVNALVPSGGIVSKTPFFLLRGKVPVKEMVKAEKSFAQRLAIRIFAPILMQRYPYSPNFFLEASLKIKAGVDVPVSLLGGVDSADAVEQAMNSGFELVALGRALLADPDFIPRMEAGEQVVSRCTHCNACIGEMDIGGVRCVLP